MTKKRIYSRWDALDLALLAGAALIEQVTRVLILGADDLGIAVPIVERIDDAFNVFN